MKITEWSIVNGSRFLCVEVKDETGQKSRHGSFTSSEAATAWVRDNFQMIKGVK